MTLKDKIWLSIEMALYASVILVASFPVFVCLVLRYQQ
jgi:hypothetical protein